MCGYFCNQYVSLNYQSLSSFSSNVRKAASFLLCAVTVLYSIATAWLVVVVLALPLHGSDALLSVTTAA